MKKVIATLISAILIVSSFLSFNVFAKTSDSQFSYVGGDGTVVNYFKDDNGDAYVIENGEKIYIAVPVSTEKVTNNAELFYLNTSSKAKISSSSTFALSKLPYEKHMDFSIKPNYTDVLYITAPYFHIKCSDLNPSGAKRGFSYYVWFSPDNSSWEKTLFVCESLRFYTRHRMADFASGPYIKIHMWSYYGTVDSCLLSMK